MKIGVNARLLTQPYSGIGKYTLHLFRALAEEHPQDKFTLLVPSKIEEDFPENIKIKVIPEKKWLIFSGLKKGYWERIQLPKFFQQKHYDIIHNTYPCLGTTETPTATTIHDIIPFLNPLYRKKLRSKIYFWLLKRNLKRLAKSSHSIFLTVSETTRKDFTQTFKIPQDKVITTYESVSEIYRTKPENSGQVLREHNIIRPYLLYVGGYDERKNIPYLLEIFKNIQKKHPNLALVLAGGQMHKDELYASYNLQNPAENTTINLLKTGFIEEHELNALYRESTALINVSQQEGFNLPILEAATTGTPVVTSDIEVHSELYKDHALLLNLENPEKATEDLDKFLSSKNLQEEYRARAKSLREKYTWPKTIKITHEAYNLINRLTA